MLCSEIRTIATKWHRDQQYTILHLHIYPYSRSLTCYMSRVRHHITAYSLLTLEVSDVSTEEEQGDSGLLGQRNADNPPRYTISTPADTLPSKLGQLPQIRRLPQRSNKSSTPGRPRQRHAPRTRHRQPSRSRPLMDSSTVTDLIET